MVKLRHNSNLLRELRHAVPPETLASWGQFLLRREMIWSAVYVLIFAVVGSLIALGAEERPRYQTSQIMPKPLVARARFTAEQTVAGPATHPAESRTAAVTYEPNDVFIAAGAKLDDNALTLIDAERRAYEHKLSWSHRWLQRLGMAGLIGLIGAGLWSYIAAYNPRIASNPTRGFALTSLILLAQFLAVVLTTHEPKFAAATAAFPALFASILLAIAYDQRFAMVAGAVLTLLITVSLDLPVGFGLMLFTGVVVSAAQLKEVSTRSKLVWVGVWSGLAMGAAAFLVGLYDRSLILPQLARDIIGEIVGESLAAILAGIGTGLLVQGLLPAIERIFKVTTALKLKELNDASHPLLRRLAQEAPGTYQHSLRLADLCEQAAGAIGANALLCKVGAMYHDIGKINKPQYFIENQAGGPNRHRDLSPSMSLLIVVGHVKDGVEMAREHSLPSVLRQFIESHHGTTLVEYFYHQAKKQSDEQHRPAPPEYEFRYPGPKPQTRETAVLMLCDSIEAAARSLPDPEAQKIERLVHTIASKRLMDGQFDECSLTLQELHRIEDTIARILTAMYHGRIAYPGEGRTTTTGDASAAAS